MTYFKIIESYKNLRELLYLKLPLELGVRVYLAAGVQSMQDRSFIQAMSNFQYYIPLKEG